MILFLCPRCGHPLEQTREAFRCPECLQDWHLELAPGKTPEKTDYDLLISERTKAGIARARSRGVKIGRPRKKVNAAKILELHYQGMSTRKIAREVGVSQRYVVKFLDAQKIPSKPVGTSPL